MARGAKAPRFAGGRLAPGLRLATHNVRGIMGGSLSSLKKVHQLFSIWWTQLRLDIVCVQEVMITADATNRQRSVQQALDAAAQRRGHPGYSIHWGCNAESARSAGVAILVRRDLPLEIVGSVRDDADGRLMTMRCRWAGHDFQLVNCYLPSGDPAGQRQYIESRLQPLLAAGSIPVMLAGDWNFTPDWRRDRISTAEGVTHHQDEGTAQCFASLPSVLIDAYRHRHPQRRSITYHGPAGADCRTASRLDRIYVSPELAPRVFRCLASPFTVSDHLPVLLHLLPISPVDRGRGMRRTRMDFWGDEWLQQDWLAWLRDKARDAPDDSQSLLAWWSGFKRDLSCFTRSLNQASRPQLEISEEELAAQRALREATDQVDSADAPAHAIGAVLEARRRFILASAADAGHQELLRRFSWLRSGERPSRILTQLIRPPKGSREMAALRCISGGLVTDGRRMACMMADAFAAFSIDPPPAPAASAEVLAAVRKHAPLIPESSARAVGAAEVTAEEVQKAARLTQPGTAPGPDGLPAELWRRGGEVLYPLLARVFSAVGQLGTIPEEMLEGVVSPIFKAGDAASPGNYRPITLLNTDYRLLAKVLNARLSPVLARTLGPEQSAFLPGRLIGDNVAFLQLLPEVLRANAGRGLPTSAVLAFLDFRKAYDTVSRSFLFAAMEAMGAGEGFIRWTSTLLSSTRAAAVVNGHVSPQVKWTAGVRQGCPLSPSLYLFVAAALQCWLKECPSVGVEVTPGHVVHATQYADDTQPLLRSLDTDVVQTFLGHIEIFREASGQGLNLLKTRLLVVGDGSAVDPSLQQVCGLQVVQHAKSLGIAFSNDGDAANAAAWPELLSRLKASYERISRAGLSVFGRAQAAAAYGVSQILYHVEHLGLPDEVREEIHCLTTRLVDKGQVALRAWQQHWPLPGIPSALLAGSPVEGGFGALPWREHSLARAAMWVRRLLRSLAGCTAASPPLPPAEAPPLWVPLARDIVIRLCPAIHPVFTILAMGSPATVAGSLPPQLSGRTLRGPSLPDGPLARWAAGLHALGPVADVQDGDLPVGDWCGSVPLWGNPLLQLELPQRARTVQWAASSCHREDWVAGYPEMVDFPGLHTLRDLAALLRILNKLDQDSSSAFRHGRPREDYRTRQTSLFTSIFGARPRPFLPEEVGLMFSNWTPARPDELQRPVSEFQLRHTVDGMWEAVPSSWRKVVMRALPSPMTLPEPLVPGPPDWRDSEAAVRIILDRLGWGQGKQRVLLAGGSDSNSVEEEPMAPSPPPLTVRAGTRLLLGPVQAQRLQARSRFVAGALTAGEGAAEVPAATVEAASDRLTASMRILWKLPWENERKETFWRLAINGVPAAGGHDIAPTGPCPCGWQGPPSGEDQPLRAMQQQIHVFWSCPIAAAVRESVSSALPLETQLPCSALWLLQTPSGIHSEVWSVACAAAVEAMNWGRRYLWALSRDCEEAEELLDHTQTLITAFFPPVAPASTAPVTEEDREATLVRRASHRAVAQFWCFLQDFVEQRYAPEEWRAVAATHPFIGVLVEGGTARLLLNLPPGVEWEGRDR